MGIAVGGYHFEYTIVDGQEGHIERAATEVEDQNVLLAFFLVQSVSNGCGGPRMNRDMQIKLRNGRNRQVNTDLMKAH